MTFKSFDLGVKAGCCHNSEVLSAFTAGFFVMATSNIANHTGRQLSRPAFLFFQTSKNCHWLLYGHFRCLLLEIQGGHP